MSEQPARSTQTGFSLIESVIAMSILTVGLLGLSQVFLLGRHQLSTSSPNLTAREKAREAIESVHTARDTRLITWALIRNEDPVADIDPDWGPCSSIGGGVFNNGAQPLATAGADGLINTDDDGDVEAIPNPGPDGILGTVDDVTVELNNFSRALTICDVNAGLREIRVTIQYYVGQQSREYRLRTFISSYS